MKCLVDANISPSIAEALNALSKRDQVPVVHLRDRFSPDATDQEWLRALAESPEDWFVLSGDFRITKKPHERKVWSDSGLTVFFLQKGFMGIPFWEQAWKIVKGWPIILRNAQTITPGNSYLVPVSGKKLRSI